MRGGGETRQREQVGKGQKLGHTKGDMMTDRWRASHAGPSNSASLFS